MDYDDIVDENDLGILYGKTGKKRLRIEQISAKIHRYKEKHDPSSITFDPEGDAGEAQTREKDRDRGVSSLPGYEIYPIKRHFYIDIEKDQNLDLLSSDFPNPSPKEINDFLGSPPSQEDLPDWLKEKDRKTEQFEGFFSQVPHALLCDPSVPHAAVRLFALYQKYCKVNDLRKNPSTFVSKKTIGKYMGVSEWYIWYNTKLLEQKGWLSITRQKGISNIIKLFDKSKS